MSQEEVAELVTFSTSKEAYVYAPLPAATSYGHRAELWNPDRWLKEVKVKVVTAGDTCYVRMLDKDNGELFAECPLPHDGTPLTTAVEPVVDSSRYFVVKVVDRESRNHAFIGIGFRERMDASDFTAALDDYRQYLRRKQEAEQMRQQFSRQHLSTDGQDGETAADGDAAAASDFSLKPGQTIRISLSPSLKRTSSGKSDSSKPLGSSSGASSPQLKLAPPPSSSSSSSSSGFFKLQPPPSAAAGSSAGGPATGAKAAAGAAAAGGSPDSSNTASAARQLMAPASNPSSPHVMRLSNDSAGTVTPAAVAAAASGAGGQQDDDWGDFVS